MATWTDGAAYAPIERARRFRDSRGGAPARSGGQAAPDARRHRSPARFRPDAAVGAAGRTRRTWAPAAQPGRPLRCGIRAADGVSRRCGSAWSAPAVRG